MYVAEAGRGGASCQATNFGEICTGLTGSVTAIDHSGQRRVLVGLPSYADPSGFAATGPHDVAVRGKRIAVTVGLQGTRRLRRRLGPQMGLLGHVVTLRADETLGARDLARHTGRVNADGGGRDSNAHGIVWTKRGKFVTDAGGNSLARMTAHEPTKTVAVFPRREV
ncbi:MAG: ScyD/ScyE family protein, partial [Actinomycetota bacterium]|nr:ScyD/ScyE family protein [Actinomycetota bacterium]